MKGEVGAGTWRGSKKETIWNRNYVLCMLVSACASFAQSMFNPAMPVYGQTIGLSTDIIGMITGVAMFICMFGRGITGKLSDTMSKKCLVAGPVFCAQHRDKSCLWGTFYHFIYSGACSDFAGSLSRVPH